MNILPLLYDLLSCGSYISKSIYCSMLTCKHYLLLVSPLNYKQQVWTYVCPSPALASCLIHSEQGQFGFWENKISYNLCPQGTFLVEGQWNEDKPLQYTVANTEPEETGHRGDVPKPAGRLIWDHHRFPGDAIKNKRTYTEWKSSQYTNLGEKKQPLSSILGRSICFKSLTSVDHVNDITKPFLKISKFCLEWLYRGILD